MKQQLFTTDDAVSAACAVNTKRRGRLLAMAAGILSVLILLVTAMQFVISAGADRYSEYSNSCRKYMMAFMKNDSTYSQLVNATRLPYRNYVESLQRDQGFLNSLTAWKAANLDLSGGVSEITQSAEYKYYLGILMDLMTDTVNETDLLDAANAYMDALHISLAKQSVNTLKKYNELSMKVDKEDSETLLNEIGMLEEASDVLDLIGDIGNVIEKANDLGDLIDKISQLCAIHDLTKGYSEVMRFMCDACDSDNIALKSALAYMRDVTSGALTEEMASAILTGQTVADDALKSVLGAVKKSVLSVMGYGGTVISFAQSLSKYVANQLFATDNIQSAFYKSRALYDIEDLLRLALKGTSSADRFFAAFSLYENVMYKGADYSVSYYKAVYEDSIFGKVFAWIQGNGDAASKFKSMMSDEKDRLKVSFDNLQRRAYNGYKGLAHTSEVGNLNVRQEYIIPDLSDLVENDAQLNKLSIETYGLPDEDYTLTEDMTLYANVYHSNGTIDLNGHSLTILGDLVLEGGCVKINGGQLNISGDYNAAIPVTNSDGTTGYKGGYLDMGNINDKVTVSGDFNTCIDYIYDYDFNDVYSYLNKGVLEIGGNLNDFYNNGSSYSDRGLCSKGTKFIFNGTGNQTVTAADGLLNFKNVEFNNSDITFKNTEITCYIEKDEIVNGDLYIREIDLNGHKLTVNGNLQLRNKITLNGGELYIAGDYNAAIPVKNSDGTTGYTGGYLDMGNINDKVTVSGDFNTCIDYIYDYDFNDVYSYLNKGVLEIGGNLNDFYNNGSSYSDRGLCSKGTKFIFNGTGNQTVTAADGLLNFKNVEFNNSDITFKNTEITCYIEKDEIVNGDLYIREIDLNGHKLTVNGNLQLRNKITLNGGELYIAGDYNAAIPVTNSDGTTGYTGGYLNMNNVNDKVSVTGDFNTCIDYIYDYDFNDVYSYLNKGVLEIGGNLNDFYNNGSSYSDRGLCSKGTKFIFNGTSEQTITVADGYICFKDVDFVDTKNRELVINCEIEATLCSDTYITGDTAVRGKLNGYDLNVSGNLTVNSDLYIQSGCLDVKGNLNNYGQVNLEGGTLIIESDYNAYKSTANKDGTTTYSEGGYIDMNDNVDKVTVYGDFNSCRDYYGGDSLYVGTIEIKGDLNDYYCYGDGYNTNCGIYSDGTKFIFNSTGKQTITALDGLICFEDVDFVNTENRVLAVNCEIYVQLCSDTYITGDTAVRGKLNGYDLNVSGNLTVNSDLYIQSGCLDVKGNLNNYGQVNLDGGTLIIESDYNAYKSTANKDGTTTYSEGGYIDMNDNVDKVSVYGDFNSCRNYCGGDSLYVGTIEIKGDLNDYYCYGDGNNTGWGIYSDGTKFIFSGTGKQTITALDGLIYFEDVDFVNTQDREFVVNCEIYVKLCSDTYITGDAAVRGKLNGYDLNVSGNLIVNSDLYIQSGCLDVKGNLYNYGQVNLDGSTLIIESDYNAYKSTANKDGTTTYSEGGYIDMNGNVDKVTVYGNFNSCREYYGGDSLYVGTIEIKGDLNDYYCYGDGYNTNWGIYSYGTKFIFSGTGTQTITALDGKLVLNTAEFVNKDVQIACSTDIDVDVPVRLHDYSDEWTVDVEAACNDGSKSHHCTRCDAKTDITVIPGKGHKVVIDAAVAPSCTEPGLTEGSHCSVCNTVIKAQETVPATGHDFENGICKNCNMDEAMTIQSKHPYDNSCDETWTIHRDGATRIDVTFTDETYTESGYDYIYIYDGDDKLIGKYSGSELSGKTISVNSDTVKIRLTSDSSNTQYGFALNKVEYSMEAQCAHSNTEIRNAKSAGCMTEGYTGDTYCKDCGEKISSGEVIPAKGHTEVTDKAVAATCTKTGLTEGIHCSVCDAIIKAQEVVPAKGHTEVVDKAVAATCTKTGLTEGKHCSVCNAVIKAQETVPATGKHSFGDWKIIKAATCTATGTKTRTCSVCGEVETATIAKTAHQYVDTVVKPTYTAKGYTLHKCSVCGTSYKDTYTAKLTLAKVTGVKLGGRAADALRINWTKNASADGYIVEMYQGNKWVRVAKITSNSTTTFRKAGLKAGTAYKFRVRAYKMEGKAVAYGAYSTELAARTNPSVIKGAKLGGRAADALRINWTKNASADGYIVEMYQGNKWLRVAKITNNNTTTFRKAGLKASSVYKFRVRAYKMSGKTALYGNYSATVTARTNPSAVTGVKIGGTAKDALRVKWTKNASAQGYIVEMYQGGKWVRVAKIANGNTTTFRKAGLKKSTTYKFRVCAYYMSGKTALYGGYGSVSGKTAAK